MNRQIKPELHYQCSLCKHHFNSIRLEGATRKIIEHFKTTHTKEMDELTMMVEMCTQVIFLEQMEDLDSIASILESEKTGSDDYEPGKFEALADELREQIIEYLSDEEDEEESQELGNETYSIGGTVASNLDPATIEAIQDEADWPEGVTAIDKVTTGD